MKTAEEIFNEIFEIPTGNLPCGERFIKFKNEIISAMEAYASQSQPTDKQVRFKRPSDKNIIDIAILFNNDKIQKNKLTDMVAMADFIIDRLYENGDILKPSSKE